MSSQAEPTSIRAGDSIGWRRSFADYPASAGGVLAYRLIPRRSGDALPIEAIADGDDFVVAVSAASTSSLIPGEYTLAGAITMGESRIMVHTSTVSVLPDLMAASSLDDRSSARKIVEAIDAWLSGKAGWAGEKTIADRSIKDHPLPDLIKLRDRFSQDIASEDAALNLVNGIGGGRGRVMVRM